MLYLDLSCERKMIQVESGREDKMSISLFLYPCTVKPHGGDLRKFVF